MKRFVIRNCMPETADDLRNFKFGDEDNLMHHDDIDIGFYFYLFVCVYTFGKRSKIQWPKFKGFRKKLCTHGQISLHFKKVCLFCLPSCKVLNFFKVVLKMVLKSLKLVLKFC